MLERLVGAESAVYHTVTSPTAGQSILNGINPRFLNPESRFGKAFYLSEVPDTTLAELEHHSAIGVDTVRFYFNSKPAKTLDLTNPKIAQEWGYKGGDITSSTRSIGSQAQEAGFNIIRYPSERGLGVNLAVLNDFNLLLKPQMIVPAPAFNTETKIMNYLSFGGR